MSKIGPILAPLSFGELLDKISILEIKTERISDPRKVTNVNRQLLVLTEVLQSVGGVTTEIGETTRELRRVNEALWDIEEALRAMENKGEFGQEFIQLARSVYKQNDRRAYLKAAIDAATGSELREEKSYKSEDASGRDQIHRNQIEN
jgi:hypothetical protein